MADVGSDPSQVAVWLGLLASAAVGYLLGGIPWALIVGKRFYKIDLREHGSGNLGATNVFRVLGWKAALSVAVLDVSKGAVAALFAYFIVPASTYPVGHDWALIIATGSAMLGHSYSPYIRFSGGKGVAVAAGALLVMTPKVWPILIVLWLVVIAVWRRVSLGSIIVATAYPLLVLWLYGDDPPFVIFAFVAAALVLWRHRSNMGRLMRGEESKIDLRGAGQRAREMAARARADKSGGKGAS